MPGTGITGIFPNAPPITSSFEIRSPFKKIYTKNPSLTSPKIRIKRL